MIKKIKTILVLLFCLVIALSYAAGCRSDSSNLLQGSSENQTEDANGSNDSIDARLTGLKNKIVSPPVVLSHKSGEEIYSSGNRELIFIKGYADKGNTIEIYVNGILKQSDIIVDNDGNFETLKGIEIVEGKNVIELVAINPSGDKSNPTEFDIFLRVPPKVEYTIYENSENLEEIVDIYYSTETNPLVYIYGSHLPASQIFIQVNDKIISETESNDQGIFGFNDIRLKPGNNEIAIWAKTSDGFYSTPEFKNVEVSEDMDVPFPSNLTGYKQGNANYLSWSPNVDADFYSYKLVRVEDPCVNPDFEDDAIATFPNISDKSYIDNDIVGGRSYYYTLWTLDKAGEVVSSNVVAIPKPVYSIVMERISPFSSPTIGRREWFYQYYEITNTGNVTVNLQPMMAWIILDPNREKEMEISPFWEVHIWNPNTDEYYYSNESISNTYIADWVNTSGSYEVEEKTTYSSDGLTKTVTATETTKKAEESEVNLKKIMTVTVKTTITATNLSTGAKTVTTTTDTTTKIVEPEKIGSLIMGLEPDEKRIIVIKIQNISAYVNDKITVHFQFAPVDCSGNFFIDEIVSTGDFSEDIIVTSSGRN
jgi:hypothetical protein